MSWLSEATRIIAAVGELDFPFNPDEASARAWLENTAPQWQPLGYIINPESSGLTSAMVHPVTGTPATTQYTPGGSPIVMETMPAIAGAGSALALLSKIPGLPAWLTGALGVGVAGAAAYGGLQALTGGGLFGQTGAMTVGGVPLGGPGVAEPPAAMVEKAWKVMVHANRGVLGAISGESNWWIYFWKLRDGRVMMWDAGNNRAKIWRPKKHIVISSNPRLSQLKKLDRTYNKVQKMVRRYAPRKMSAAPSGRMLVCKTK